MVSVSPHSYNIYVFFLRFSVFIFCGEIFIILCWEQPSRPCLIISASDHLHVGICWLSFKFDFLALGMLCLISCLLSGILRLTLFSGLSSAAAFGGRRFSGWVPWVPLVGGMGSRPWGRHGCRVLPGSGACCGGVPFLVHPSTLWYLGLGRAGGPSLGWVPMEKSPCMVSLSWGGNP